MNDEPIHTYHISPLPDIHSYASDWAVSHVLERPVERNILDLQVMYHRTAIVVPNRNSFPLPVRFSSSPSFRVNARQSSCQSRRSRRYILTRRMSGHRVTPKMNWGNLRIIGHSQGFIVEGFAEEGWSRVCSRKLVCNRILVFSLWPWPRAFSEFDWQSQR